MVGAPPPSQRSLKLGYLVGCEKLRLLAGDSYVGAVERFVFFGEAIEFGRVHASLYSVRVHQPEVTSNFQASTRSRDESRATGTTLDLTSGEAKLRGRTVGMESA